MHTILMRPPPGFGVDHKDGNGLNNTRENLRLALQKQNAKNRQKVAVGSSRFKGVHWSKTHRVWVARIQTDGRGYHLGTFDKEEDAARAYDEAAIRFHGEYARLNLLPNQSADKLLNQAMLLFSRQPRAVFIGQNVAYDGTKMFASLSGVPQEQRLEVPVAEEMQLGMAVGLSLAGELPMAIFPRIDFLMRAMDQLVNHLDAMPEMSAGQFVPKVIIRTAVGKTEPLDAGPQHTRDHTRALCLMLKTVAVRKITRPAEILPIYGAAIASSGSTLIIEDI